MGEWCEGRRQEAGREKLEECCKEQGQLAEASKEGLGSEWAVVPMMMMMMMMNDYGYLRIVTVNENFKTTNPSHNKDRPKTTGECEVF
jgi:hypothetical protein